MVCLEKKRKIKRKKNIIQEYVEAILFAFVVAMLIRNYTIQTFKIPSSSMESTLLIGDFLIGNKLKYFFDDPEQEDIVIFQYPADPEEPEPRENFAKILGPIYLDKTRWIPIWHQKKNVVKRVIGMPGDKVELVDKEVYVNDIVFHKGYEQYIDSRIIPAEFIGMRNSWAAETISVPLLFPKGNILLWEITAM
jgi:signal peptidase I